MSTDRDIKISNIYHINIKHNSAPSDVDPQMYKKPRAVEGATAEPPAGYHRYRESIESNTG